MPKKCEIHNTYFVYENQSSLTSDQQELMSFAHSAAQKAYAPYSRFQVGAALKLANGQVVIGNNQENAAYPSGMCAERVAFWKASSDYPGIPILSVAIAVFSKETKVDKPVAPCGGCRQVMVETELNQDQPFEVLFMGHEGEVVRVENMQQLMPLPFGKELLPDAKK